MPEPRGWAKDVDALAQARQLDPMLSFQEARLMWPRIPRELLKQIFTKRKAL